MGGRGIMIPGTYAPERTEELLNAGRKDDIGKPRYDLIPPEAIDVLAQIYGFGAGKYDDRNWERGLSWGRCFAAAMRHLWAFWRGEDLDPESGMPHTAHAAWNCFALLTYQIRQTGTDDRP